MPHSFDIRFVDEDERPIHEVIVAVVPIDAFTGRIVTSGVKVSIEGLPNRPWRNLSGMLVFVRPPEQNEQQVYKIKIAKKHGAVEYHYLDAEYFLPIKVKGKRPWMGSEMEYEITFGDYKEVAGLLMPHSSEQGGSGPGGVAHCVTPLAETGQPSSVKLAMAAPGG